MNYQPIENYGVIGDLHTVALVSLEGSIDFMCFPDFDSPTIFAALLDHKKGGRFQISPDKNHEFKNKQHYFPNTNILLTRFLGAGGIAQISDFMPPGHPGHQHELIRRVKTVKGEIPFQMICAPQFNYARSGHSVEKSGGDLIFTSKGPDKTALRFRSSIPVRVENGAVRARFTLRAGESAWFILEEAVPGKASRSENDDYITDAFKETMNFWLGWIACSKYRGRWREMVNRSALTLKMLTSRDHGSIVAAPTFGLPEEIGRGRNWDYRFSWIRDASFTLYALMRLGYTGEAGAFMRWTEDRCREVGPKGTLQVLYRVNGSRDLPEIILSHLEGYRGSRPVRIGNAAALQNQLDIYGELMDSVYLYNKYGQPISYDFWSNLVQLVNWVCQHWQHPDDGVWEVRSRPRRFLYSRVLCWVAVDRAIRLAEKRSFPAPLERWRKVRDEIYKRVYQKCWNPKLGAFAEYEGAKTVDASSLLMPLVKFIGPTDPRWQSTMQAIEKTLVEDSLVYRSAEPLSPGKPPSGREGTFSMCSFWYAECLARGGDLKKARFIFEKALGYANHVGLYAEELGPAGEHLGNFPQAFTHIGLISAAWFLDRNLPETGE